jgi:hypothetical protein
MEIFLVTVANGEGVCPGRGINSNAVQKSQLFKSFLSRNARVSFRRNLACTRGV